MKFEIKNRFSGGVQISFEAESLKIGLEIAVKNKANLYGANLGGANLFGANLDNTQGIYPIVPESGSFEGYKKLNNGVICHIQIPATAGRVGGYIGRKCRAEEALVLEGEGVSTYNAMVYRVGQTVKPDSWDPDPRVECSHGIHFFLTRKEAEEY